MIKKFFTSILIMVATASAGNCIQSQKSQLDNMMQGQQQMKVYNSHGSLQYTLKNQSNGTVRQYSKTGSYQATYRERAGKVIYYPKK